VADVVQKDGGDRGESTGEISAQRLAELRAIPANKVASINLSVPLVVATALAAAPRVQALRPDICRVICELNLGWIDGLEDYALILNEVHGELLATPKPQGALLGVVEARRLRRDLTRLLRLMVDRGVIPPARCPKLRGSGRYSDIATDLTVLARVLRSHASAAGTTGIVTLADLDSARVLGERILGINSERGRNAAAFKAAVDLRARAFTALIRAYEEARHAVLFVRRWENDADKIIPSLFAVRLKNKRRSAASQASASAQLPSAQGGAALRNQGDEKKQTRQQPQASSGRPSPRTDEELGEAGDQDPFL
jgi:hypothetical protein